MATGLSFAFDAEKETPQSAARRRALAEAIMGRSMAPKTLGEGFAALGDGIVANVNNARAREAEELGQAGASDAFSRLISGITGGAPGYTPSGGSGGALGAANSVGQSAPTTSSFDGSQQEFIDMLLPAAMAESERTGIDPRIIVAQAAQETGWGKSAPGNNFFGIKSHGQSGGQTLNTHEYINGERVNVADSFRTFGSPEESVRGYGDFITSNPRYGDFMAAQGLDAQLEALQASGYATDPNYSQSVGSIARGIALPQQPQRVASADPSMTLEMTPEMNAAIGAANPADFMDARPNTATAPADPSVLARNLPFRPGQQQGATIPGVTTPTTAAPRPAPMQTAQAAPMAPQGAPAPVQQPMQRPQQVAQGPSLEELLMVSQNPWLNEGQRNALNAMIETELQRQDPAYQQQLEMGDLQLEQLRRELGRPNLMEVSGQLYDQDTGEWIAPPQAPAAPEYEIIDGEVVWLNPAQQTATSGGQFGQPDPEGFSTVTLQLPDGTQRTFNTANPAQAQMANELLGQGAIEVKGSLVDINMPGDQGANNFFTSLGEAERTNYETMLANGQNAGRTLAQLDQLEGLLANTPQGFEAAATAFAGNFGIDLGNATGVQAAEALINQMVPAQRPPGSGPMSDADLELFKRSVPRLINQPGGNALIIQTMRDINTYDRALADLIQEYTWRGEMAQTDEEAIAIRREMRGAISELQNPMENFNDRIEAYQRPGGDDTGAATNQSQANPGILNAPAIGTVQDGYRFKGGDPALESNWERVQ